MSLSNKMPQIPLILLCKSVLPMKLLLNLVEEYLESEPPYTQRQCQVSKFCFLFGQMSKKIDNTNLKNK